jgi:hypothetical protein
MPLLRTFAPVALLATLWFGCGGSDDLVDPTDIVFGETTFLFVVNPLVNDINDTAVATPGDRRADVRIRSDDGLTGDTDGLGLAVLPDVEPGERLLDFDGGGARAELGLSINDGDLREVAVSLDGDRAEVMSLAVFALGGSIVDVTPDTPLDDVESALGDSDTIVFFADGIYEGDLDFSGSNVTLFGAGPRGGQVILDGNITVGGSGNRIRGAIITGDLEISGSDVSMSFSRLEGNVEISGSDTILLFNDFCGNVSISGSGTAALDNTGLAPLDRLDAC